jgi:probable HAF family extracellular repeat protein
MRKFFVIAIAMGSLLTCRSLPATTYQITDLGTLGGKVSYAFGVNIHGDVAGSSTTASGDEHAFLYHNGVMSDLGVLDSGDTFSRAYGINDSGVLVGQSINDLGQIVGFGDIGGLQHAYFMSPVPET